MRIYIIGPGWSGKSTLAYHLGAYLNTPVTHMDNLQWEEWWVESKNYKALQIAAVAGDKWIIEGSSPSIIKIMNDRVDMVIILNNPPMGNIIRVIKRYLKGIFLKEKRIGWSWPMSDVNEIHWDFLFKTLRWRSRQLPRIRENIRNCSLENRVVEIQSPKRVLEKVILEMERIA